MVAQPVRRGWVDPAFDVAAQQRDRIALDESAPAVRSGGVLDRQEQKAHLPNPPTDQCFQVPFRIRIAIALLEFLAPARGSHSRCLRYHRLAHKLAKNRPSMVAAQRVKRSTMLTHTAPQRRFRSCAHRVRADVDNAQPRSATRTPFAPVRRRSTRRGRASAFARSDSPHGETRLYELQAAPVAHRSGKWLHLGPFFNHLNCSPILNPSIGTSTDVKRARNCLSINSRYRRPAKITTSSTLGRVSASCELTRLAQPSRAAMGMVFNVSSYGAITVSGCTSPCIAERMYQCAASRSTHARASLNHVERYRSFAATGRIPSFQRRTLGRDDFLFLS